MRDIVIYIGSIMLPDKSAGAQRALSLSKSFRDLGYQTVIVGMEKGNHDDRPILSTRNTCQGFDTYAVPQPANIRQWVHHTVSTKEFIEVIEFYGADRVKCVVAMEYEAIALFRLAIYCKKKGIALVADAEEWYEYSRMRFPMNVAKNLDTWLRMYFVYPRMIKNMICISHFFLNHYQKEVANRTYIPGTIDPQEDKWKDLRYKPNEILTLGYAGSPGIKFEKERLDYLIQAVVELNAKGKACRLLLAGVDDEFIKSHVQVDEELIYNGTIVCKGQLSHRACLEMVAACDFSVIVRESKRVTNAGFPTKLSESFGCGTPVLTTRTSNIAEYITNKQWGIVCEGYDIDAIKNMIEQASSYSSEELIAMHETVKRNNPLRYECFDRVLEGFLTRLR